MTIRYIGEADDRLTHGREYVVIAMSFNPKQTNYAFLIDDKGGRGFPPSGSSPSRTRYRRGGSFGSATAGR